MKSSQTELSPSRIYQILFFIILAAGIFVRLQYTWIERMWPDEALYAWCAKRIFQHPELIFSKEILGFHPPLFPLFLSLGHFFLSSEAACRGIVLIVNILGIAGVYLLGVRIKGHFLGVFAALFMAFNFLYFNYAFFILTDGFLAVALIFFFLVLGNVTPTPACRRDAFVGLAACAIILIKWPGVLIIPFLVSYYSLAFPELPVRDRFKKLSIPLMMTVGVTLLLLLGNKILLGHWMPDTTAIKGVYLVKPVWYYILDLRNIFIVPYVIPFFVFGLWLMFKKENRLFWASALWLIIFLTSISLMKEKDLRYTLPIFAQLLLISGLGVEEAIRLLTKDEKLRFKIQILFLAVTVGFFAWTFQKIPRIMRMVGQEFTGFREAGQVIKEETALDSGPLIIASSPRVVRYYTDINFMEFGGRLMEIPKTEEELKHIILRTDKPVILVVDIWERKNALWVLPLQKETIAFLEGLNFKLIKVIPKEHRVAKGVMATEPAVAVFRYDP